MAINLCQIDWSVAAAWVQAVGSILAIGVAIWVPYSMDYRARARLSEAEKKKQRHTQILLLPTLYELRFKTRDFIDEQSGSPSFLGVEREHSEFDSDFFSLVPRLIEILRIAPDTGGVQEHLEKLSMLLFRVNDELGQNTKLQRDGYAAAWVNHKDLFIESAQAIYDLSDMVIGRIETYDSQNSKPAQSI